MLWSLRRARPPLVLQVEAATVPRHLSPSQVLCQPADSLLSVCSPELGVLFIALTLYFEVLPVQVGRPALHSLDLGTGSSGRIPPPEWQRGPRGGVILPIWVGGEGRWAREM